MIVQWYNILSLILFNKSITLIWYVWFRRSSIIHDNCNRLDDYWILKSIDTAKGFSNDAGTTRVDGQNAQQNNRATTHWSPPEPGYIKINVDARIGNQ